MDTSDLAGKTDEELLRFVTGNPPGTPFHDASKAYLQMRMHQRMIEIANRTDVSSKRLEFATWVILVATVVQLALFFVQVIRGH